MNNGGPAFPQPDTYFPDKSVAIGEEGMTLRDWFAGLALQGLLTHDDEGLIPEAARDAYRYADAMLKAREAPE